MKIKTNSKHKSFSVKSLSSSVPKRIFMILADVVVITGLLVSMSGCRAEIENQNNYEMVSSHNGEYLEDYYNGNLSKNENTSFTLGFAPIDEDFINNLPSWTESLWLENNSFISNLDALPDVAPNIEDIYIRNCFKIHDFNFIMRLNNLKSFTIEGDTIGITQELIDYLDSHNISHNLSKEDVKINDQVQEIIDSIITDDMSEDEKLQQISLYVINNIKYNMSIAIESNEKPLTSALSGEGVCISFAALTSALCAKAGVESTVVLDYDHAWNLVCIEGKYYYVDTTNIKQIPILSKFLLEHFNVGFYYKQDPYATGFSAMSDLDKLMTETPERIIELINESNDQKSFIEKYGSNLYVDLMVLVGVCIGFSYIREKVKRKR